MYYSYIHHSFYPFQRRRRNELQMLIQDISCWRVRLNNWRKICNQHSSDYASIFFRKQHHFWSIFVILSLCKSANEKLCNLWNMHWHVINMNMISSIKNILQTHDEFNIDIRHIWYHSVYFLFLLKSNTTWHFFIKP